MTTNPVTVCPSRRSPRLWSFAALALSAISFNGLAAEPATETEAASETEAATEALPEEAKEIMAALAQLKPQSGTIVIGSGLATIQVPDDLRYLDSASTRVLLEDLWGNPEGEGTLGMIVPAEISPLDDAAWGVIFTYEDSGHVEDDDAAGIDYSKLLADMKKGTASANKDRESLGYPPIELVGWAAAPRYDAEGKKLYWAKELRFGGSEHSTLNYNIRVLGRKGVLNLNAVASMDQLAQIDALTPKLLASVDFNPGNRYADFDPATDRVAEYGIAALVAGGVAAKTGVLKALWVGILAFKKFIVMGFIAVIAMVGRFFRRSKATSV